MCSGKIKPELTVSFWHTLKTPVWRKANVVFFRKDEEEVRIIGTIDRAKCIVNLEENLQEDAQYIRLAQKLTSYKIRILNIKPELQLNSLDQTIFMC